MDTLTWFIKLSSPQMVFLLGKFIATISADGSLKMWKVSSNSEKFTLVGKNFHSDQVVSMNFHDTKPLMITGGEDGVFIVSNSDHGEIYHKSPKMGSTVEAVCFASSFDKKT